jgi:phosphate acetyltransferase/phosphate butyryltransferase
VPRTLVIDASSTPNDFALADLAVGDSCEERWTVDPSALDAFVACSADRAPVHVDPAFARSLGYPQPIVHGMLTTLRFSRLLGMFLPGTRSVILSLSFDYAQPVFAGETLRYGLTVAQISAQGVLRLECSVQRDETVCARGRATCLLRAQ